MSTASLRRRRVVVAAAAAVAPLALMVGFGHRGVHAARGLLVPGAGLVEAHLPLALMLCGLAVVAIVAWLRWGVDWAVAAVLVASVATSAALAADVAHHPRAGVAQAAHEFPLVVLVVGLIGSVRSVLSRTPGFRWTAGRRAAAGERRTLAQLDPVDRCRAVAIAALAGCVDDGARVAVTAPDVARRARRVGLAARLRRGADPFRVDHAHARAALALTGALDGDARRRLAADAARAAAGVPASEPGWVRTLDGTLVAAALDELGETVASRCWADLLAGPLAARRGHRPVAWWSPLGIAVGRCLDWEHAAATAIAHARGWLGNDDWPALRRRVLGAAARGSARRDDERLIAAGRVWLALVDDPPAERVVARPSIGHDPLAVALDQLAQRLRAERAAHAGPVAVVAVPIPSVRGAHR